MKLSKKHEALLRAIATLPTNHPGCLPITAEAAAGCESLHGRGLLHKNPCEDGIRYLSTLEGRAALSRIDDRGRFSVVLYAAPETGPQSKTVRYVPVPCNGAGGTSRVLYVRGELKPGLTPELALEAARPRKGETVLNSVEVL